MQKYVDFIKKNRKLLIIIFISFNILALIGLFKIRINPDFQIFMPEKSEYKKTLNKMNVNFSSSEQISFLLENTNQQLSSEVITNFRQFQRFLEGNVHINYIQGPTPQEIKLGMNIIDLDQVNPTDITFLDKYYNNLGKLSPFTFKNNRIYGEFLIFPADNFSNSDLHHIEDYLQKNDYQYFASGDIYMQQKVIDYILLILLFMPPTAFLLILSIFRSQMGSLKATLFSILPAGIAALWTLGTVGWIGKEVSVITVLAPIFTIVIGSADGLHFVSHIQEARSEGEDRMGSIVKTLKMVGIPMIITTVTSIAGFLSLLVMNTNAIHDLALFFSLGIFLAGIATWYVLPLILTGEIKINKPIKKKKFLTGAIKKIWGPASIAITLILLITSLFGMRHVKTEFNLPLIYRDFTAVHQNFEKIKEVNGGSIPVYLLLETKIDPLNFKYANDILDFENKLVSSEYLNKAVSIYDFYSTIFASFMSLQKPKYPDQMMTINLINTILSQQGAAPTSLLINRKENITRIMLFPTDLKNQTLDAISKQVANFNEQHKNINARVTGVQYLMRDLNQNMINNQSKTLILSFLLILLLLFISLRKILPSLISLLPIGITVVMLFGFLGFSGISLNLFTATIFSITIGVGIDYAVHFTTVWRSFRKQKYTSEEAVEKAYAYTSRPIMANALGLSVGLSALLFSPLRIHLYVSTLIWVSMISSVFLSLSFLPTILKKLK